MNSKYSAHVLCHRRSIFANSSILIHFSFDAKRARFCKSNALSATFTSQRGSWVEHRKLSAAQKSLKKLNDRVSLCLCRHHHSFWQALLMMRLDKRLAWCFAANFIDSFSLLAHLVSYQIWFLARVMIEIVVLRLTFPPVFVVYVSTRADDLLSSYHGQSLAFSNRPCFFLTSGKVLGFALPKGSILLKVKFFLCQSKEGKLPVVGRLVLLYQASVIVAGMAQT